MPSDPKIWSRGETVLAYELATKLDFEVQVHSGSEAVIELSRLLRGPHPPSNKYRNPFGVACKVRRLAQLDAGGATRGGAQLEKAIVAEFIGRPDALAAEAAEARKALAFSLMTPSRGPAPSFGETVTQRQDGETFVYLAVLRGVALQDGRHVVKIGRSSDIRRRVQELNAGLPGAIGINWEIRTTWRFRDGGAAHSAEQAMLTYWGLVGWSLGGEFFAADDAGLEEIERRGPSLCERPQPPGTSGSPISSPKDAHGISVVLGNRRSSDASFGERHDRVHRHKAPQRAIYADGEIRLPPCRFAGAASRKSR